MVFSKWNSFFFCHVFLSQITENSQNSREREGNILIPLPFPPAYKDLDLSLQFCKWADYHVFSIASLVIIILPLTLREKCPNTEFFLVRIFPHSQWIPRDTPYLCVFSPNAGKYGPEEDRIWTLFTQCQWDLPPWRITIWLISNVDKTMSISVYLII